jgi:hypothetical protein
MLSEDIFVLVSQVIQTPTISESQNADQFLRWIRYPSRSNLLPGSFQSGIFF